MIDTAIVGLWSNGGSFPWSILRTGEVYISGPAQPYEIPDGDTLIVTTPDGPETFVRIGGSGPGLVGTWSQTHNEVDGVWVEEWALRSDGSFTIHWTLDGAFHTEHFGWFTDSGTELAFEERRGYLSTGPAATMVQAYFWLPVQIGTYSVAPDGHSWTFHQPSGDVVYNRV